MTIFESNRPLLDAFRNGDQSALAVVYRSYFNEVEGWVRAGFHDPKRSVRVGGISRFNIQMEIIQDVFLRAFGEKARLSYDGVRPYRNYLFFITKNVVMDYLRKRRVDAVEHAVSLLPESDGAGNDVSIYEIQVTEEEMEEALHFRRCMEASESYISQLSEKEQAFVGLRFREELPQEDVARRLHLSRWKVRSLEARLQKNIMRFLKRSGLLDDDA